MHNNVICGIDPGQNTGVSFITIDNDFKIIGLDTFCLQLPTDTYVLSRNNSRTEYLNYSISELLNYFNPFAVGVELPFQHRFANAVIQLSQYLSTINTAIYNHSPYLLNYRYPPKFVKRMIGATGNADKLGVSKALLSKPDLNNLVSNRVMTEHEADATAIAYITYEDIKNFPFKILMNRENFNYFR